ncbi:hypothetical protein K435DRAFT_661189 [Dendrothele bispora CBS 962.96]|uniref:C4-dicarboxylate transporter/malic acid transport protein n=1 Tax=Dendrothele bispora (strain CBS 962.96) TaxID=1314807 RepID=A0A4S8M832_DENBC|nr:hypothetical protein K435DRAFT_661189 [Dendrothele bispora CBS 962.96]
MSFETQAQVGTLARRIHGWSWQAFPIGMGTGAVYVTLSAIKGHSSAFTIIETVLFFVNMTLFLLNTTTLALQAVLYPQQAWRLIKDPVKGLFVPLIVLSFATIIIGTINYAFPKHVGINFLYVLFWIYVGFAVITCFPMLMIWFNEPHDLNKFTPAYAFLVFPLMLVGVVSFNVLRIMDPADTRTIGVLITGYVFQGIPIFSFGRQLLTIIYRSWTGFLDGHQANGAFVACGPPGFTALALINLGARAREILDIHGLVTPQAGEIWYAASVMSALMLYGLAVFLFLFGAIPYWFKLHKHLNEILGCWALTFPNVGWINTTRALGDLLNVRGLKLIHIVLTIAMAITWCTLIVLTALAFWKGLIFLSREEDVLQDKILSRRSSFEEKRQVPDSARESCQSVVLSTQNNSSTEIYNHRMV